MQLATDSEVKSFLGIDPIYERRIITLDQLKLGTRKLLPRFIANTALFEVYEQTAEYMAMELRAYVLARKQVDEYHNAVLEVPATWWQHLKQDYFPEWYKRRWPIRFTKMVKRFRFERYDTYPEADFAISEERFGRPVLCEFVSAKDWRVDDSIGGTCQSDRNPGNHSS